MSTNFVLADFVSRVNVALDKHLVNVKVVRSNIIFRLLLVLLQNGIIRGFNVKGDYIIIFLKYHNYKRIPSKLELVSRPGRRIFWKLNRLSLNYQINNFGGFYIISTSKGFITSSDSLLGTFTSGEVLLKVSF